MSWSEIFNYDAETGLLSWAKYRRGTRSNSSVGCHNNCGYIVVGVNGKRLLASRIIWEMNYGLIPNNAYIDHINGVRDDNRIANLRLVTRTENNKNAAKQQRNTSGVTGVSLHKLTGKWKVTASIDKKQRYIGLFSDFQDACDARKNAELAFGYHENHGRAK